MSQIDEVVLRLDAFGKRLDAVEVSQGNFMKAFPAEDVEGHRRYHELKIQELEERRKLRVAIQEKTISALIWSGIVFLAVSTWRFVVEAIIAAMGKPPT